jgi:hypothetical protein
MTREAAAREGHPLLTENDDGRPTGLPLIAPLGLEPRLSSSRVRRVASYTKGQ